MRPGIRSTEAWLSFIAVLVGAVMASGLFGEESTVLRVLGICAVVLNAMGYTVARTALKRGKE